MIGNRSPVLEFRHTIRKVKLAVRRRTPYQWGFAVRKGAPLDGRAPMGASPAGGSVCPTLVIWLASAAAVDTAVAENASTKKQSPDDRWLQGKGCS
ncbi:hypothetical protein CEXT_531501 [Caerostris extrusa]|uniref:Uncharacterized protein n=1 Tax=Caerostris extrusa TaxID=172846 RepID=A0AAV4W860_CAEEX|nr:hypothetical protein CEXT_531501 [Caerostris extrusa]